MSRLHIPKGLQRAARLAHKQRWEITPTGSGHLKWKNCSNGEIVITGSSPHEGRTVLNSITLLRNAGLRGL